MGWEDWQYHRLGYASRRRNVITGYESYSQERGALRLLLNDDREVPDEAEAERFCKKYLNVAGPGNPDGCPTTRPVHVFFTDNFELARKLSDARHRRQFVFDGVIQDIIHDETGEYAGASNLLRIHQGMIAPLPAVLVVTNDGNWAQDSRVRRVAGGTFAIAKIADPGLRSGEEQNEINGFFRITEENRDLADSPLFEEYRQIAGRQTLALIQEFMGYLDDEPGRRMPLVILGKSGTGKEAVARLIHLHDRHQSDAAFHRFQPVLVASIPPGTLQGELFSVVELQPGDRERVKPTVGYIEKAERGTLFIDEIGDVPKFVQGMLLRFLQEHKIRPVGGEWRKIEDVRCVFATHKNLRDPNAVDMREDFLHRIDGLALELPELKDREEDLEDLLNYFIGWSKAHEKANHDDPFTSPLRERIIELCRLGALTGNIRQLKMLIYRIVRVSEPGRRMDIADYHKAVKFSLINPEHALGNS